MVVDEPARTRIALPARIAAVLVVVAVVVGTLRPWRTTFAGGRLDEDPAWTSGAVPATGAVLAVLGAVLLAGAAVVVRRRPWVPLTAGAAVLLAGAVTLLVDRYRPFAAVDVQPVTVAVGLFRIEPRNAVLDALPGAVTWLTVGALLALAVVVTAASTRAARPAGSPPRASRPARVTAAVGVVGAVLLVVGASALPWSVGPTAAAQSLWRANGETATGAALLAVAAVLLAATALRTVHGATVVALLVAAVGLGLLLPDRLPNPWADRTFGFYSYQPLDAVRLPAAWQFHLATTLVLAGAVVVLVGAAVATRRARG